MKKSLIEFYTRLAHGLAVQFGSNCEVVVHDLQGKDIEHSIIAIENGHVTGRRIGDGPSQIVLEYLPVLSFAYYYEETPEQSEKARHRFFFQLRVHSQWR